MTMTSIGSSPFFWRFFVGSSPWPSLGRFLRLPVFAFSSSALSVP
jgi:hypothetical protein